MKKLTQADIDKALDFAENVHGGDNGGHGIGHILRVMSNARKIMSELKGGDYSSEFVLLCCALHDVDDKKLKPSGERSRLDVFLEENGYDGELCAAVKYTCSRVSFSENRDDGADISLDANIVRDADRLDALGAVGIARAFAYGGQKCRPMFCTDGDGSSEQHFYDKLFLLPSLMNTEPARREALRRVEYMNTFIKELRSENDIQ